MLTRRVSAVAACILLALAGSPATPSGQKLPTISLDLLSHARGHQGHRVIVQADEGTLQALRGGRGGRFRRALGGAVALDVTDAQLEALARNPAIAHVSGDLPVTPTMAVTNKVTAATSVWQGTFGLLSYTPGYMGAGVGVAIVDSGIAAHAALADRPIVHVNFVSSEPSAVGDPYGHGTHVASTVAGNTTAASKVTLAYSGGSAPKATLVDVRVLGKDGVGLTSDVIAGIDWVVANRAAYNIKVINLSLGHAVTEPSSTDPLCQAVARAVAAGITVVVAAGNYGQAPDGAPILGGITSPGDSPFALTVGAIDTNGTIDASDDVVAPYSSRGPTEYELVVKPDVVAPGTRIVAAEAFKSYLSTTYPQWHIAGTATNAYMRLSGTSMATAVVSGGAALLLNAYPSLTPAQVKIAMQMGARFMGAGGLNGAGAGSVNFQQSLKVAQNGLLTRLLSPITNILGSSGGAAFRDAGTLTDRIYDRTGINLLGLLDLGFLFRNADDASEWGVLNLLGLTNPLASVPANRLVWGDVSGWTSDYYVVWGSTIQSPSGQYVVWGSGDYTDGTYVVWGSSIQR